jgi:hypothetical protein
VRPSHLPVAFFLIRARVRRNSPVLAGDFSAVAGFQTKAENLQPTTTMGDKNPKAKRKLQAQHELQKRLKAEETQRHQRQIYEMRHPEESPNQEL